MCFDQLHLILFQCVYSMALTFTFDLQEQSKILTVETICIARFA